MRECWEVKVKNVQNHHNVEDEYDIEEAERIKNELDPYIELLDIKQESSPQVFEEFGGLNCDAFIPATTSAKSWKSICAESSDSTDTDQDGDGSMSLVSTDRSLTPSEEIDWTILEDKRIINECNNRVNENINFLEQFGGRDSMQVKLNLPMPSHL